MTEQLGLDLDEQPKRKREGRLSSFHARSHVTAEEAQAGEKAARAQEASILGYFRAFSGVTRDRGCTPGRFTPSEVHAMFPDWPITSIRRALTNLTTRGLLVHYQGDRRPGPRGARESTWGLA